MSNGYEAELYQTAPESKHIRPIGAMIGGVEGFILLAIAATYLVWCGFNNVEVSWSVLGGLIILSAPGFGYMGWYFGVRGQDKINQNLLGSLTVLIDKLPKASGGVVVPTEVMPVPPVVTPVPPEITSEEPKPDPIPFDPVAFSEAVNFNVAKDYAGIVNPSTTFFEARDKTFPRWREAEKLNNNVAYLDLWETLGVYANKAMAYQWSKASGIAVTDEFEQDPLQYVTVNFSDFRNCPSCKDQKPTEGQLVDTKWLALVLGEGAYVAYLDLLNAQKAYAMWETDVKGNGIVVW